MFTKVSVDDCKVPSDFIRVTNYVDGEESIPVLKLARNLAEISVVWKSGVANDPEIGRTWKIVV